MGSIMPIVQSCEDGPYLDGSQERKVSFSEEVELIPPKEQQGVKADDDIVSIVEVAHESGIKATFHKLLLAWALFVKRGSLGHLDEDFVLTWRSKDVPESMECLLSKLIPYIKDEISEYTPRFQQAMGTPLDLDSAIVLEAKPAPSTISNSLMSIEARIRGEAVELKVVQKQVELSQNLTRTAVDTLASILRNVAGKNNVTLSQCFEIQPPELNKLWEWGSIVPDPIARTIHSYFCENAEKYRDKAAVVSWDGELTYAELDHLSTQLAHKLKAMGLQTGSRVPVCFEKSMWTVVAVVAVLKVGSAFVLMDPSQPERRLTTIIDEVEAGVVLTSEKYIELGRRLAPEAEVFPVGPALRAELAKQDIDSLPEVLSHTLMYIIFTSGSTGKPKGVMITHDNYTSGAIPRASIVGYEPDTRVLDFASYAFDVSIDCMLLTLATGGCICVPSDEDRINNLSHAIRRMDVNMVHTTPSIARVFDADVIPSLKVLGLGGEAVPAHDAARWNEQTRVLVAYGPSECTVGCAFARWDANKAYTSLGKGCGAVLWLVDPDDHDRLSPIGAPGELLVEGAIVGEGYLKDPAKTAAAFIEDPTWLIQGVPARAGRKGRLYKTGDLVRYDPDGSGAVVFVGRKDQQVKIRGQRVELEEVEHHLRTRLPCRTAVAADIIRPGGTGDPMLAAFVVEHDVKQEQIVDGAGEFSREFSDVLTNLERDLKKDVPVYMVPGTFIAISQIPTTVSGKTDRKQLQAIAASLSRRQLAGWRTQTKAVTKSRSLSEREDKILGLWSRILGNLTDVSPEDNFFALGGDSLKAMRLVALAREQRLSLTMATIFAHPTLEALADNASIVQLTQEVEISPFSMLQSAQDINHIVQTVAEICKINVNAVEDIYPCTPLQEALMALSAKVPEAYTAQRTVTIQNKAEADRFSRAFDVVTKQCPILRTRIVHLPSHGLVQVVLKTGSKCRLAGDLHTYLLEDRNLAMELGSPLCRTALVQNSDESTNFVLTMHHSLYDGWSMPLIVDRINRAYKELEQPSRASFKSFLKHFINQDRRQSESFWRVLVQGTMDRQFPVLPHPQYETRADSLLERYVQVPSESGSRNTLATIIRGAWALTVNQCTKTSDIVFGETLTGRNADVPGIDQIEAPLITTVPTRIQLRNMAVSEYLDAIHQQTINRMPHEHLGLQNIRLLSRDARVACDLRTGFVMHPSTEGDSGALTDGPASGLVPAGDNEAAQEALKFNSYALMMVCTLDKRGFLTMASFDSNTISVNGMKNLLEVFDQMIQALSTGGDKTLSDICDLTENVTPEPVASQSQTTKQPIENSGVATTRETPLLQTQLAELWSRILHIDKAEIGNDDDFFDLGGDSIAAMKLVSELRRSNFMLTVAQIFASRQLSKMADLLQSGSKRTVEKVDESDLESHPLEVGDIDQRVYSALSEHVGPVQRVYLARPLQAIAVKGTTHLPRYSIRYEMCFMESQVDKAQLLSACRELVRVNEILRTVFVTVNGKCFGGVVDEFEVPIDEFEVDTDIEKFSRDLCDLDVSTRMPEGSSFVKFFYVQSEGRSCLIFRLSHAQYDEMCLPNMLQQLSQLYEEADVEQSLPFSSYVRHAEMNLPSCAGYWSSLLRGSKMSRLRGPGEVVDRKQLTSITKAIDIEKRPRDVTLATFPTAAWALCLARRLRTNDVVFGEVVGGRNTGFDHAHRVAGPCWQYVPIRVQLEGNGHDLLRQVQTQHVESSQFETMGLTEIVEQCTDWKDVDWFDSVVHQAVKPVESVNGLASRLETYYPHAEPLREWKIQAFVEGNAMELEVVTFREWSGFGEDLLNDLVEAFEQLVFEPERVLAIGDVF
ncbi:hypothetical protein LTS08_005951 [Lithohypha guttulata]|uniref:NRPS protein n=1 Tax=Lithohypha guttulata TaxID=1690604 RepID=UPI002DE09CED|nr:hypothetical protein LTR51_002465 [Lithohypha guttulata]KAK5099369.1 hypothetical protein LTS08_005951 [Lithohypha guttulata]